MSHQPSFVLLRSPHYTTSRQQDRQKTTWIGRCMFRLPYRGLSGVILLVTALVAASYPLVLYSAVFAAKPIEATVAMNPPIMMEARLRGALWGFFSGDALAAPTHWYYGGLSQIQSDYGRSGIADYTKPKLELRGSIMNKSNTSGGGRGSFSQTGLSIIGDVINHGKRDYWDPAKSIHYHATLQKGENTLEAQLARVLMKSIVATKGKFDADHFREAYIAFMTTPGSHNDTYASTCHRMFFRNLKIKGLAPKDCPDNDHHNVDTIDGLVLPTISAMTASNEQEAGAMAAATAATTRKSTELEGASRAWGRLVYNSLQEDSDANMSTHLNQCARDLGLRSTPSARGADQMTYVQNTLSLFLCNTIYGPHLSTIAPLSQRMLFVIFTTTDAGYAHKIHSETRCVDRIGGQCQCGR